MFRWLRRPTPAGIAIALLVAVVGTTVAHEKGVLRLATREFPAGGTVRIAGEKFTPRAALDLVIIGTRGRLDLIEVHTDSSGAFTVDVVVPRQAAEGAYRLLAIASDGDEVAAVDVVVVASIIAPESVTGVADHVGTPSADPLVLERARSSLVTGGTIAVIGIALVLGLALLRRPAHEG